jgi:hypothetical protein
MRRLAQSVALSAIAAACLGGCRDWGRFESVETGGGGSGAGNAGGGTGVSMPTTGGPVTTTTTADATTTGPGGGGTGGNGDPNCGKIDILLDSFDGGAFDWRWEADLDYFTFDSGDLVIDFPDFETGFQIDTTANFDFRGRTVILELSQAPVGTDFWFNVAGDRDNYVEFVIWGGSTLAFTYEQNGDYNVIAEEPFDPRVHRFFRFREEDGTVYYDTSPDGTSWNQETEHSLAGFLDPEYGAIFLGGYTNGTNPDAVTRIVGLTSSESATKELCEPTVFTDDFADGVPGWAWSRGWEGNCALQEDGALHINCGPTADSDAAYGSASAYDLRESSVSVEIVDYPEVDTSAYMSFVVSRPETDSLYLYEVDEGNLVVYEVVDGNWSQIAFAPYDPIDMRFLRIRESGGTVYFEKAPDGQNYTTAFQRPAPFSLSEVQIFLRGGAGQNAAAQDLVFDNLNLGP